MKQVHVECLPDEALIKRLGFTRKSVIHHAGKSRVFKKLESLTNQLGMVDEDPGSVKTSYEKNLVFVEESQGIKLYQDEAGNKVVILKIKLEDWIISQCRTSGINMRNFGLPDKPNDLHDVINQRIIQFEKLIDHLLENNNAGIVQLKNWLN
jgi:hypothetical protein